MLKGYKEAEKIDKEINLLLENNPITKNNEKEWLKFARIIKSGLIIIEDTIKVNMED